MITYCVEKMKILEINNLKKTYDNGKIALEGINLSINSGEFIALLGPNGAGKSTLINILADVVIKTSGEIIGCGYNMDSDKINFKRRIGIVPQDVNFDPFFTPFQVLKVQQGLYGLPYDESRIYKILEHIDLKEKAHSYARSLSGGMKRRLLIGKAIIHDPEIIILDEPTAGVDVELRQNLWRFLKQLNAAGKTIILTTHYLEEAQMLCDKIAIINKGKLITYEDKKLLIEKIGSKKLEIIINKPISNNLQSIAGFNALFDSTTNTVSIDYKQDSDVNSVLVELHKNGYSIKKLNMKESNLEDVFLKLTTSQ